MTVPNAAFHGHRLFLRYFGLIDEMISLGHLELNLLLHASNSHMAEVNEFRASPDLYAPMEGPSFCEVCRRAIVEF
jgi:hypothetical protein